VRLWFTGDQGWSRAAIALIFGGLTLAPAAYFGWLAVSMPPSPDVSTDFVNPPALVNFVESRFIGPEERERIEAAYPNARPRTYPIEAPQMFGVVETLIDAQGWEVRARRAPTGPLAEGQINAVVTTLLGFAHEVVLSTFPDFGQNGQRVEGFLLELDNQVTLMLRNAPAQPAAVEDD
jgi:hypothetical protein